MLALRQVSAGTGPPRFLTIFDRATLLVEPGQNTLIYGDNGSGKSTLVALLLGEHEPISGEVTGGHEQAACFFEDIESQLFFSTVSEEMDSFLLRDSELENILLDGITGRNILELSYSEKARLAFASALLLDRKYLIIDAPPVDSKISDVLALLIERGCPTIILLLPEGDSRILPGKWEEYQIKNKKICRSKT
ncbi:MAG: ATP-binding cassette domain-containing protein [Elusimicrobia bacterium]|nr:ATP-binding cassette domain-containing protein [Elusimicrobiota bacterium]